MNTDLTPASTLPAIHAMTPAAVDKIRAFEVMNMQRPQIPIPTSHLLHAGMYARTITIPKDTVLTGALIKRATILIFNGDATIALGEDSVRMSGYHVIPASAHRKQAFVAHADTHLTMLFPSHARSVAQAEAEFTDEANLLFSRRGENVVNITGE